MTNTMDTKGDRRAVIVLSKETNAAIKDYQERAPARPSRAAILRAAVAAGLPIVLASHASSAAPCAEIRS